MARRYCEHCDKTVYETKGEAMADMEKFKNLVGMKVNGKRIKHRIKKPEQKRAYYCPHADGFHLTKWDHWESGKFKSYEKPNKKPNRSAKS